MNQPQRSSSTAELVGVLVLPVLLTVFPSVALAGGSDAMSPADTFLTKFTLAVRMAGGLILAVGYFMRQAAIPKTDGRFKTGYKDNATPDSAGLERGANWMLVGGVVAAVTFLERLNLWLGAIASGLVVIGLVFAVIGTLMPETKEESHTTGTSSNASSSASSTKSSGAKDPYKILGLDKGASAEEVKNAYRKSIAQYHPDKVASLGPELQELAGRKAQEINEAYEECLKCAVDPARNSASDSLADPTRKLGRACLSCAAIMAGSDGLSQEEGLTMAKHLRAFWGGDIDALIQEIQNLSAAWQGKSSGELMSQFEENARYIGRTASAEMIATIKSVMTKIIAADGRVSSSERVLAMKFDQIVDDAHLSARAA